VRRRRIEARIEPVKKREENTKGLLTRRIRSYYEALRRVLCSNLLLNSGNFTKTSSFSSQKLIEGLQTQINGESKQINKF
jgi:N-glycosylase/DNA lyase